MKVQLTCQNVMLCLQIFGGGGEGAAYLPAACRAGEVVWSRGLLKKGEKDKDKTTHAVKTTPLLKVNIKAMIELRLQ